MEAKVKKFQYKTAISFHKEKISIGKEKVISEIEEIKKISAKVFPGVIKATAKISMQQIEDRTVQIGNKILSVKGGYLL